jgi:hypothetical protein
MSLFIKDGGTWQGLLQGSVSVNNLGSYSDVDQIYVKQSGIWFPVWDFVANTDGKPRWGVAQFSDTDFLGGKSNPNQAGLDYDVWTGEQHFMDSVLVNEHNTQEDGIVVNMTIPFPDYGYFAHPISMGVATFTNNANSFIGGWNGIQWPDGGFNSDSGPLQVVYDDGDGPGYWAVYRTDFSGIGTMSWTVDFSIT